MRKHLYQTALIAIALHLATSALAGSTPNESFGIHVVDDASGRGVPMVELQTTSHIVLYTDSAGYAAFYEPGLMNHQVWFTVASHGYEFPTNGFGLRGAKLKTTPGEIATLSIKRLNVAERLYRTTGAGIYRDSILLGLKTPLQEPLLNAEVTGQDSVLNAHYRNKLYWFYGDTDRLQFPLGNFATSGAISLLPDKIDPNTGFDLHYFTNKDGFARAMAPIPGGGVVWLSGVVVLPDGSDRESMFAFYQRRHGLGQVFEQGFVKYNDLTDVFEKVKELPLTQSNYPRGNWTVASNYLYFCSPYPQLRVRNDWSSYSTLDRYEVYTCLKNGELQRDAEGKLIWSWQIGAALWTDSVQDTWIKRGRMTRDESPFALQDADTGHPVSLNNCSCFWNDYRHRYIMIASESMGATVLGEVWFAEAEHLEGPWHGARKIITHANKSHDVHDFYNPTQHPFFDREGGRIIYLEGTYANTFSGNAHSTPNYEYNQIMYRLDLSDPRLK